MEGSLIQFYNKGLTQVPDLHLASSGGFRGRSHPFPVGSQDWSKCLSVSRGQCVSAEPGSPSTSQLSFFSGTRILSGSFLLCQEQKANG